MPQYPSIVDALAPYLSQHMRASRETREQKARSAQAQFEDKLRRRAEEIVSQNAAFETDSGLMKNYTLDSIRKARAAGTPGSQAGMVFPELSRLVQREDPDIARNRSWFESNAGSLPEALAPYAKSGQLSPKDVFNAAMDIDKQKALEKYRNAKLASDRRHASLGALGNPSKFEQEQLARTMLLANPQFRDANSTLSFLGKQLDAKRNELMNTRSSAMFNNTPAMQKKLADAERDYLSMQQEYITKKGLVDSLTTRAWAGLFAPEFLSQVDSVAGAAASQDSAAAAQDSTLQEEEFSPEFIEAMRNMYLARQKNGGIQ